jgi:hypothetical protein
MAYQKFDGDIAHTTVADLKAWMDERLKKGVVCPACDRKSKVNTRKLTYLMSVPLILGWRSAGIGEWVSFEELLAPLVSNEEVGKWFEIILKRKEWRRLTHWELLVADGDSYAITELGEKFVKGEVSVPAHYYEHQSKFAGWMWIGDEEIKYVNVVDTLGTKFNWKDLMP